MRKIGLAAAVAFMATVVAANWLVVHVGLVGVGFGLVAPAGVYAVGVAFTLRDVVHRTLGPAWVIGAIAGGAVLSLLVSSSFALASGAAFLISELADLAVYSPLERRSWTVAVVASNIVGLVFDSFIFLWLSPLPVHGLLEGQVVGKAWMTVAALILLVPLRKMIPARELAS